MPFSSISTKLREIRRRETTLKAAMFTTGALQFKSIGNRKRNSSELELERITSTMNSPTYNFSEVVYRIVMQPCTFAPKCNSRQNEAGATDAIFPDFLTVLLTSLL